MVDGEQATGSLATLLSTAFLKSAPIVPSLVPRSHAFSPKKTVPAIPHRASPLAVAVLARSTHQCCIV